MKWREIKIGKNLLIIAKKLKARSKTARRIVLLVLLFLIFGIIWLTFHWIYFIIISMGLIGIFIVIAHKRDKPCPYICPILKGQYFKTKFRISLLKNKFAKNKKEYKEAIKESFSVKEKSVGQKFKNKKGGISKLKMWDLEKYEMKNFISYFNGKILLKIKLFFDKCYLKFLHYLILLANNSKEGFEILREELQEKNGKVVKVTLISRNGRKEILNIEKVTERIKNGNIEDLDILEKLIQKLFELHKKNQVKVRIFSLIGTIIIICATALSGLITSFIFPNIFKSNATTYNWQQTDWLTLSSDSALHGAALNWNKYSSKDDYLTASSSLALTEISDDIIETSNTQFESGILSNGQITGTGDDAYIKLASSATTTVAVSAGYEHACVLYSDNTVGCWGNNADGQLGDNSYTPRTTPVPVYNLTNVSAISAGGYHTCALITGGTVKCWGRNGNGQLGDNTTTGKNYPVAVLGLTDVAAISAGANFTCALITGGTIKCWGGGLRGEMGNGTNNITNKVPAQVSDITTATNISMGYYSACALLSNGAARCWGYNLRGILGNGTETNSNVPVEPQGIDGVTNIAIAIETEALESCAILSDHSLKCWGANSDGQIGIGTINQSQLTPAIVTTAPDTPLTGVESISVGNGHVCARVTGNTVKCWGKNDYGEVGDGTAVLERNRPVDVPSANLSNVESISTSNYFSCARLTDSRIKCWGRDDYNQLGDNRDYASGYANLPNGGVSGVAGYITTGGLFTSQIIDANPNISFGITTIASTTTSNNSITIKVRTGDNSDLNDAPDWSTCDTIGNNTDISDNNCVSDDHRYIQYQASFSTWDTSETPQFESISFEYYAYPCPALSIASQSLISSPFNSGDSTNVLNKIEWSEAQASGTDVKFQIRTSSDGLIWTDFLGPSGADSYYTDPLGGELIYSGHRDGANDRWFQYKAYLISDGNFTPYLHTVTLTYIVNAKPEFEDAPVVSQDAAGLVNINYAVRDGDTVSHLVTPSFQYSLNDGTDWTDIVTGFSTNATSTKSVEEVAYSSYSPIWTAGAQVNTYSATAKIKVIVNDGQLANNIASSTSAAFTLDTKAPLSPSITIKDGDLFASSTSVTLTISAVDDVMEGLEMMVGNDASFTGASWEAYATSKAWTLIAGDGVKTVYIKFKDWKENISSSASDTITLDTTAPGTPQDMTIRDITNYDTGEYRLFLAWGVVNDPGDWQKYNIWRSTNGADYGSAPYQVILGRTTNYIVDTGLDTATTYYYKITTQDTNNNVSAFSAAVSDRPNGQGGTDTTPPAISVVASSDVSTTQATITWTTDELSRSTVGYSTTAGNFEDEIGVASMVTAHSVILTGLAPDTTYYFEVQSQDPSGNIATSTLDVNGYTFSTDPGPEITSGSVTASIIENTKATIEWKTDIESNSYVVYSTHADLSSSTQTGNDVTTTNHAVTLTGLTQGTKYYYYVKSTEGINLATDNNGGAYYDFTTTQDATAPIITFTLATDITNTTASSTIINWTTNEAATSTVSYGLSQNSYTWSVANDNYNYNHSLALTGLQSAKTYYFKIMSTDANGQIATDDNNGADYNFTTLDSSGPLISAVSAGNTTLTSAQITWTTNELADSFVQYATSTASFSNNYVEVGSSENSTDHQVTISGLSEYTTYYFLVKSQDVSGNITIDNDDSAYYSFTTTRDITAPSISNMGVISLKDTSAVITWKTSEGATSKVEYSISSGIYTISTTTSENLDINHAASISGLTANTKYYYHVISSDAGANTATSTEQNFTTLETLSTETEVTGRETTARSEGEATGKASISGGGILIIDKTDKTAPAISNISIADIGFDQAKIIWKTNEAANSFLEYGNDLNYGTVTGDYRLTEDHSIEIDFLSPEKKYNYRVVSVDSSGNLSQSANQIFSTVSEINSKAEKPIEEIKESAEAKKEKLFKDIEELTRTESSVTKDEIFVNAAAAAKNAMDIITGISTQISISDLEPTIFTQFKSLQELSRLIPPPLMSGEPKAVTSATTAMIAWKTDKESNSLVAIAPDPVFQIAKDKENPYIQTVGSPNEKTKEHVVTIYELKSETVYHYQIRSQAEMGPMARSSDFIFQTKNEILEISNYAVQNISNERAAFKWVTNLETDSRIKYIPYRDNKLMVEEEKVKNDKAMSIIHELEVDDFEAGIIYKVELSGEDMKGQLATKEISTYSTSKDDLPPIIYQVQTESAISPGKEEKIQTVISWLTNEPSTSLVYYMKGIGQKEDELIEKTSLDNSFVKKHVVIITKFNPGAVYSFKVESIDSGGNMNLSKTYTILTPRQKESVFQVIMKNLEQTFGWVSKIKN